MAVAAAAALLDELMGRSRNEGNLVKKKKIKWEDPEYCKYYMVKFCPHDLFVNTKADLGPCPKLHCEESKSQFNEAEDNYMKLQYEEDFVRFAQGMLNEVERKIIKGEQRLALMGKSEPVPQLSSAQTQKNEEQISLLSEKINELVTEAEQTGIQGNVEQAQGLMKLCDQLKEERETLRRQNENSHWSATVELAVAQEKQMEVCKVCGAFLIVGDAQSRIDDHLMGKQHTGYGRLKGAVQEITKKHEDLKLERQRKREEERNRRIAEREREEKRRESDRRRSRSRDRDRGRGGGSGGGGGGDRDRNDRNHSYRDERRSRSRDRRDRDRSYDRGSGGSGARRDADRRRSGGENRYNDHGRGGGDYRDKYRSADRDGRRVNGNYRRDRDRPRRD